MQALQQCSESYNSYDYTNKLKTVVIVFDLVEGQNADMPILPVAV